MKHKISMEEGHNLNTRFEKRALVFKTKFLGNKSLIWNVVRVLDSMKSLREAKILRRIKSKVLIVISIFRSRTIHLMDGQAVG